MSSFEVWDPKTCNIFLVIQLLAKYNVNYDLNMWNDFDFYVLFCPDYEMRIMTWTLRF